MAEIICDSAEKTYLAGREYAGTLRAGDIVLLYGEMGAGKTVFTKGIAAGLGIEDEILSPTYAYMNDYYGKLYHYDCYRLSSGGQADRLGLTEYFGGEGVCVIEWPENIADALPRGCKKVRIEKLAGDARRIIYE